MKTTLTETLRAIVAAFDAADAREVARWGAHKVHGVPVVEIEDGRLSMTAVRALAKDGMITIEETKIPTERLRRGAYGRWIGGTIRGEYTHISVMPTAAGRKVAS